MASALRTVMSARGSTRLALFGHSGGATLAVLLAERFPETIAVVTLAGNLDIEAWARIHGYTPLRDSLNPIARRPLSRGILQKHYVGTLDRNVTPGMLRHFAESHPDSRVVAIPGFDHDCCWNGLWPTVLQELAIDLAR
jgi:acetyl esterase/lipase